MKTMRHVQTWLLITLLTLSANGDVWGKRLETNWNGNEVRESQTQGNQRGYTDHEHLDSIGLIHMNGRVYEAAEVARGIATGEITGQEAVTGAVITAGLNLVGGAAFKTVNKVTPPVVKEQIKDVVDKALRKNTDAQHNLSDKPTRTADAPDGRGGNNNVNGDAVKSAEAAADVALAAGRQSGSAAELVVSDKVFTGISREVVPENNFLTGILAGTPKAARNKFGFACAEIVCINKALNAGVDPTGGTLRTVNIGISGEGHKTSKKLCSACTDVAEFFDIKGN